MEECNCEQALELKEFVEKMKCCGNCEFYCLNIYDGDEFCVINVDYCTVDAQACDKWSLNNRITGRD